MAQHASVYDLLQLSTQLEALTRRVAWLEERDAEQRKARAKEPSLADAPKAPEVAEREEDERFFAQLAAAHTPASLAQLVCDQLRADKAKGTGRLGDTPLLRNLRAWASLCWEGKQGWGHLREALGSRKACERVRQIVQLSPAPRPVE